MWEVLEFKWLRHHSPSFGRDRNMLRAAVVLGTGLLACAIPNFGLFVSLIGSRLVDVDFMICCAFIVPRIQLLLGSRRCRRWCWLTCPIVSP